MTTGLGERGPPRISVFREGLNGEESDTTVNRGKAMHQMSSNAQQEANQLELALETTGEAPKVERSGEAGRAAIGGERSGNDYSSGQSDHLLDHHLMELVVERGNAIKALKRVRKNKGSPGIDGMRVEDLSAYLREHWAVIREQFLAGNYQPSAVKRQEIPKSGGGMRELGIPTVLDRFIQQAILQVLQPRFDPTFSEHSHGFRPGRGAHDAVREAQRYIGEGRRWVVDVDLEKFFDRVNHDVLMGKLGNRIKDERMLRTIRRYLEAGVMAHGVVTERREGTPQGGPLSPLLANVLLDEVDKELERCGHAFVRYADDCNVYVRSKRAGDRVMRKLHDLYAKLRLRVNEEKSAVARVWGRKFLGYSFWVAKGRAVQCSVAAKALGELKERVRQITCRNGGRSMNQVTTELRTYLRGWKAYFRLAATPRIFEDLDKWLHRRIRAVQLKQWKQGATVYRELRARGVPERVARAGAAHAHRWWRMAAHGATKTAMPNSYFDRLGIPRLGPSLAPQ